MSRLASKADEKNHRLTGASSSYEERTIDTSGASEDSSPEMGAIVEFGCFLVWQATRGQS